MATSPPQRVTFSPGEFAALFGKAQTWGYRQIYAGRVKAITEYGRIMIPAAEVERILATAGIYDGIKPAPAKSKAEIQKFAPKLKNAWQSFLQHRRVLTRSGGRAADKGASPAVKADGKRDTRKEALARLARKS